MEDFKDILEAFVNEKLFMTISIDSAYNPTRLQNISQKYAVDFDYNDGEEGANGSVFIYANNQCICEYMIFGGDDYSYEFTDLGNEICKKELKYYFDYLIAKL